MTNWKEYKFSDFVEVNPKVSLKKGIEYSFVEMKDLSEGNKFVAPSQKRALTGGSRFENGDTLFARITPCLENGKICQVQNLENGIGFGSTEFLVFRGKEDISDSNFVHYLSLSNEVRSFAEQNMVGTSGRQRVSWQVFENLVLTLPDLPTQTAIAEILSSLDDKIELNNKINQELENLAQTLFKQWFIDFEFPNEKGEPYKSSGGEMVDSELGEIPKRWEVKRLEILAKISLGGTPSRNNGDYWNGNIPWVNSGALNENYILNPIELITQEGLGNSSTKLIPKHSTLIAITGATLGQVSYSLIDACYNQSVISLTPPDNIKEFIHLLVNTIIPELIKHQTGGAQQHINKGNVETFKVKFPPENILKRFKEILTDLYLKIECNLKENQQLTNLRDTLLPKLISGELEVSQTQTTS
jgi:type I restriction enzyme S subunit